MSALKLPSTSIGLNDIRNPDTIDLHQEPYKFYELLLNCRCFYAAWYGPKFNVEVDRRLSALAETFASSVGRLLNTGDEWFGSEEGSLHVLGNARIFCTLSALAARTGAASQAETVGTLRTVIEQSWHATVPWLESGLAPLVDKEKAGWKQFADSFLTDLHGIAFLIDSIGRDEVKDAEWCEHTQDIFAELMQQFRELVTGVEDGVTGPLMLLQTRDYVPPATHLLWCLIAGPPGTNLPCGGSVAPFPSTGLAKQFRNAFEDHPWWGR
jgi:hypothetical protein